MQCRWIAERSKVDLKSSSSSSSVMLRGSYPPVDERELCFGNSCEVQFSIEVSSSLIKLMYPTLIGGFSTFPNLSNRSSQIWHGQFEQWERGAGSLVQWIVWRQRTWNVNPQQSWASSRVPTDRILVRLDDHPLCQSHCITDASFVCSLTEKMAPNGREKLQAIFLSILIMSLDFSTNSTRAFSMSHLTCVFWEP